MYFLQLYIFAEIFNTYDIYTITLLPENTIKSNIAMKNYFLLLIAVIGLISCEKNEPSEKPHKGLSEAEAIDLGLPSGTLWAPWNIGAEKPQDYGNYYAWAETTGFTEGKTTFGIHNYEWCDGTFYSLKKYNTDSKYGAVDNLTELELEDDAAYVNWGGNWRTPTKDQLLELFNENYTHCNRGQIAGVNGWIIRSLVNDNMIFLPYAGTYLDDELYEGGEGGFYWSSTLSGWNCNSSWAVSFEDGSWDQGNPGNRWYGCSVRAVINPSSQSKSYNAIN